MKMYVKLMCLALLVPAGMFAGVTWENGGTITSVVNENLTINGDIMLPGNLTISALTGPVVVSFAGQSSSEAGDAVTVRGEDSATINTLTLIVGGTNSITIDASTCNVRFRGGNAADSGLKVIVQNANAEGGNIIYNCTGGHTVQFTSKESGDVSWGPGSYWITTDALLGTPVTEVQTDGLAGEGLVFGGNGTDIVCQLGFLINTDSGFASASTPIVTFMGSLINYITFQNGAGIAIQTTTAT
jgi:hypothetical protein